MVIIMKIRPKNLLSTVTALSIATALVVAPSTSVFASTYADTDSSGSMQVTATLEDTYTVELPATLSLKQKAKGSYTYENTYDVGCKGLIDDTKKVVVHPDSHSYTMTGQNTGTTATGSVTQEKTDFVNSVIEADDVKIGLDDFSNSTGKVSITFKEKDNYAGIIGFTFGVKDLDYAIQYND